MFGRLFGVSAQRQYAKGMLSFNAGRLAEAIVHFDEVLSRDRDDEGPEATLARFYKAEAHARLGSRALDEGDARVALSHFESALEHHPSFPDLHDQRAIAHLLLGDAEAGVSAARGALELNPDFIEAGATLTAALARAGQEEEAARCREEWATRARERGHDLAVLLEAGIPALEELVSHRHRRRARRHAVERAEAQLRAGAWNEAREILAGLVEETPGYPDLRLRLAAALTALGDDDGARVHLEVALTKNPKFADAHVLGGMIALHEDDPQRARDHFERAEKLGSLVVAAEYGLALCELRCGLLSDARKRLARLAGAGDLPAESGLLLAALDALRGEVALARERYEVGLARSEDEEYRLDAAAWALSTHDHALLEQAVTGLQESSSSSGAALARAELMETQGKRTQAIELLGAEEFARDAGVQWRLATLLADEGRRDEAMEVLQGLYAITPLAPGAGVLAARLLRERGSLSEAAQRLSKVTGDVEGPDVALENLYLLRCQGEVEGARALWENWRSLQQMDLRWRLQDPTRWMHPLRPWPREGERRERSD